MDIAALFQAKLEEELASREEILLPMYHQVAVKFVDLHDTPDRMQEKGCIDVSQRHHYISTTSCSVSCYISLPVLPLITQLHVLLNTSSSDPLIKY